MKRHLRRRQASIIHKQDKATENADQPLTNSLLVNIEQIKNLFELSDDLIVQRVLEDKSQLTIVYLHGLVNDQKVTDCLSLFTDHFSQNNCNFEAVFQKASLLGNQHAITSFTELTKEILNGSTVILLDGVAKAIGGSSRGEKQRGIEEPTSQVVIRGPKEGFVENLSTNIALIRKRLKSPKLCVEIQPIGSVTNTDVALMYMKDTVDKDVLNEVKNRIDQIKTDAILESGNIEEFIEDRTFSIFSTISNSERPDSAASSLLEGKIVILVDGTPFCLIAPYTFFQAFQAAEDYYHRYDIATLLRWLRFISFFISLIGTAVYIAATSYHPEMIPTPLLLSLAAQREGMPFPIVVEALLLEFSIEILREAGIRMPRAVGQAVSIVGALILGETAVQAGIVSPGMVIIVALTAICSFTTPTYNLAISIRMLRFVMILSSAAMGLYGILIITIIIVAHVCSLQSFGVPFMTPIAPFQLAAQKDTLFRLPIWSFQTRSKKANNKSDEQARGSF
jgi:spore germination protein KA